MHKLIQNKLIMMDKEEFIKNHVSIKPKEMSSMFNEDNNIPKSLYGDYRKFKSDIQAIKEKGLSKKQIRKSVLPIEVICGKCGKTFRIVMTIAEYAAFCTESIKMIEKEKRLLNDVEILRMFQYKSMSFLTHMYLKVCPGCMYREKKLDIDGVESIEDKIRSMIKGNINPVEDRDEKTITGTM